MSKKRKGQRVNNTEKTYDDIPEGFLRGEPMNHPQYGHGFITDVSADGMKVSVRFDFDGFIRFIVLPDELHLLFACEQTEAIISFLEQRFGHCECRRCHKRLFPDSFTPKQKEIYDSDQLCEQCEREKFECPICHDRFFLKNVPANNPSSVLICHSFFKNSLLTALSPNIWNLILTHTFKIWHKHNGLPSIPDRLQ